MFGWDQNYSSRAVFIKTFNALFCVEVSEWEEAFFKLDHSPHPPTY